MMSHDPQEIRLGKVVKVSLEEGLPEPVEMGASISELRFKGWPKLAWLTVICVVVINVVFSHLPRDPSLGPLDAGVTGHMLEMQAKYLVGVGQMVDGKTTGQLYDQAAGFNTGPVGNRLSFVVVAGELAGPQEALVQLEELERAVSFHNRKLTEVEASLIGTLKKLYADYDNESWSGVSLSEVERSQIRQCLGWCGSLALIPQESPDQDARRDVMKPALWTVGIVLAAFFALTVGFLFGLAISIMFFIFAFTKRLRLRLMAGSSARNIYLETFGVWLVLHLLLGIAAGFFATPENSLYLQLAAFACTLLAILWPRLRGVSWSQVKNEIGLFRGGRPWIELVVGFLGYISLIPFLVLNILLLFIMLSLMSLFTGGETDSFASPQMPAHPIVQWVAEGSWMEWTLIFLVACVAAPIVEEIMFRGLLYRYFRDFSAAWRLMLSIAFSASISSFIFAVIHPQGFLAVPALSTLAAGFCLLREWRGSLIAPMVAHGLNNAVVTTLLILLMST